MCSRGKAEAVKSGLDSSVQVDFFNTREIFSSAESFGFVIFIKCSSCVKVIFSLLKKYIIRSSWS